MTFAEVLQAWTRPAVLQLVGLAALSVLLWRLPLISLLFYPFRLFNTFVHELSHGLAAMISGGEFHRFYIHPGRDGLALVRGGSLLLVASAGYVGSALFGAALLFMVASALANRTLLVLLGGALLALCLVFVRNLFGFVAGLLLAAAMIAAGLYLPERYITWLLTFLAIQTALSALDNVVVLMHLSLRGRATAFPSDAQVLARHTGIPALVWALLWCLIALGLIVAAVPLAARGTPLALPG
jgi:hypothetical protein